MIIHRALYRETVRVWLAIVVVLLGLFMLQLFGFLLSRAARGEFAQGLVWALFGLQLVGTLDLVLPLGLYFALLLSLGRWYRDNEMAVLAACGIGLPQLFKPVVALAGVCVAMTAALSLYLSPWAERVSDSIKLEGRKQSEASLIVPGVFSESRAGGRIVYAESLEEDGELRNVFIASATGGSPGMVLAKTGRVHAQPAGAGHLLALRDGSLYEGQPGEGSYRIAQFELLNLRLEPPRLAEGGLTIRAMPTSALLVATDVRTRAEWHWRMARPAGALVLAATDVRTRAEWHWRMARPAGALVLVLFALALAYTDPRRGRAAPLIAAILVYFIYTNVLTLGLALLRNRQVPDVIGLWWVHATAGLIGGYVLWRRAQNRPLLSWSRPRP